MEEKRRRGRKLEGPGASAAKQRGGAWGLRCRWEERAGGRHGYSVACGVRIGGGGGLGLVPSGLGGRRRNEDEEKEEEEEEEEGRRLWRMRRTRRRREKYETQTNAT